MLTNQITRHYGEKGYYFPYTVFSHEQAQAYAERFNEIMDGEDVEKLGYQNQINHLHVLCPFVNDIVRNVQLLDGVASILGPDILCWGATLFVKPSQTASFVSWHQDLTYWGLSSDQMVSAWLALGTVNQVNGCMRYIPKSHKLGQLPHQDKYQEKNILTRGQQADTPINEEDAVYVELQPGQASFHHGHLLHASGPNKSDRPRIGMAINYIATSVSQSVSKTDYAMLVRGEDKYANFRALPNPKSDFHPEALKWHREILKAQNDAIYAGADNLSTAPNI